MNSKKHTTKVQEIIQQSAQFALENGQQAIETGHVLQTLLKDDSKTIEYLLKNMEVDAKILETEIAKIVEKYPKVSGGEPYFGNKMASCLIKSESLAKEIGDEFVSMEVLFLSLVSAGDETETLLKKLGVTVQKVKNSLINLRGNQKVLDLSRAMG